MKSRIILLYILVAITIEGCFPVGLIQQNNINLPSDTELKISIPPQDAEKNQSESKSSQLVDYSQKSNYYDAAKYNGEWISTNYQIVQLDGYTTGFGSELYLEYRSDGIIEMNMHDISSPPANRIASIETEIKITSQGTGRFTFDNDGWGSHGSGTIELHDGRVIINIDSQNDQENNPDWRIYSGERVFIRENMLSDSVKH